MPESVLFPAKVTITEDVSPSGLPVTEAHLEVEEEVKALPLPTGPQGAPGPRGVPMPTWVRQDPPIANSAARPTGLTDADIGKWWHRLDDNGMDTWTDEGWKHSPNCVGVTGPPALATAVTVSETLSDPKVRTSGIKITGPATDLDAKITVPAGPQGIKGPNGESTALRTRSDYDDTIGVVEKSMFAWKNRNSVVNLGGGKFRAQPFPNGYGPWTKYDTDFPPETALQNVDAIDLVSVDIPPLPFRWRPHCTGRMEIVVDNGSGFPIMWARLNSPTGKILGAGGSGFRGLDKRQIQLRPYYSEATGVDKTGRYDGVALGPSSTACTVEPYEPASIFFRLERAIGSGTATVSYANLYRTYSYVEVRAIPVSM